MDVTLLDNSTRVAALGRQAASRGAEGFAALMKGAGRSGDADAEAREAAQQLVATALVAPMLAEIRDQPLDAKLFHGGPGEDSFRQQLDTILADRIVRSERFPLVDRIYEQVMRRAGAAGAAGAGAGVDAHG